MRKGFFAPSLRSITAWALIALSFGAGGSAFARVNRARAEAHPLYGLKLPPVYCADGVDCHDKYVSLTFASKDEADVCSGVLIAPDLVLTNRHCIAVVTTTPGASFAGWTVVVSLPGRKNSADSPRRFDTYATELVAIAPENRGTNYGAVDWAILRLDGKRPLPKATTGFPRLSREGILPGRDYHIYSPAASSDVAEPDAIEQRVCKARARTIFAPGFSRARQAVVSFADCLIGPGNSGSPIYNEREELVGIIGGQMNIDLVSLLGQFAVEPFHLLESGTFQPVGWGVNLACIPDGARPLPAECGEGLSTRLPELQISSRLFTAAINALAAAQTPNPKFEFVARRLPPTNTPVDFLGQDLFVQVPKCVRPAALPTLNQSDLSFAVAQTGVALSELGELTERLAPVSRLPVTIETNVAEIRAGRIAPASLKTTTGDLVLIQFPFGVCGSR